MKETFFKIVVLVPQLLAILAILFALLLLAKKLEGKSKVASFFLKAFGKKGSASPSTRSQVVIFSLCAILVVLPLIFKFGLNEMQRQLIVDWISGK